MKISLMVMSAGATAGKALPINAAQFIIGRDPQCNLRPASAMISKRHCAVLTKNDLVFLRDFESTNGTFLNDQQVKGEVPLKDGDILKIGPLIFKVVIQVEPALKTLTPPPPKPKTADGMDDDAAAALLSVEDADDPDSASAADTAEDQIPGGSTVTDYPVFKPGESPAPKLSEMSQPEMALAKSETAVAKPEEAKPAPPKGKPALGAAQDAAKALLDRLRTGKRK